MSIDEDRMREILRRETGSSEHPLCHVSDAIKAMLAVEREIIERARNVAINHSNYGHVEGNRRAFAIADDLRRRLTPCQDNSEQTA